jgi:flagellar basal-body rod protein FlgG
MIRSLYTAATGMKANQMYVDNISHNLANVNTMGYKKSKLEFEDLIYQNIHDPGQETRDGVRTPTGLQIGLGVRTVANQKIFIQGNLQETGSQTDVAIEGDGFFQVRLPNGEIAFTRSGSFKVTSDGQLATSQGFLIEPPILIPDNANDITIDPDGRVAILIHGGEESLEVGQIELARFLNPGGLKAMGANLFLMNDASGVPVVGIPGEGNLGYLRNQFLEASNVQLVEEMVNMIIAQRAYEVSSKSIQTSDDMLQTASNLKR